jgi:ferredoxin
MNFTQFHILPILLSERLLIMAKSNEKHPENILGPWYVDTDCICCALCGEYAPASFQPVEDGAQHAVYHQPTTVEELAAANEAKEGCPVDAIGNDG